MKTSTKLIEENYNNLGIDRKSILMSLGLDKMIDQYVMDNKPKAKTTQRNNKKQYNGNKNQNKPKQDEYVKIYGRKNISNTVHRIYRKKLQKNISRVQYQQQNSQKRLKSLICTNQEQKDKKNEQKYSKNALYSTVYTQAQVKKQQNCFHFHPNYLDQKQFCSNSYLKTRTKMFSKQKNQITQNRPENKISQSSHHASSLNVNKGVFNSKSKATQSSNVIKIGQKQQIKNQRYLDFDTKYYDYNYKGKVKVCSKNTLDIQLHSSVKENNQTQKHIFVGSQRKIMAAQPVKQKGMKYSSTHKTLENFNVNKNKFPSNSIFSKKKHNLLQKGKPKLLKDRYELQKIIGRGMSGQVYRAKDILADRFIAIKIINSDSIQYQLLKQISHPNIIQYLNSFIQNGKRYLVLQYFPMTLNTLLKQKNIKDILTEQKIRHIFKSVAQGLGYLHGLSIAHRDVKLDNIVISQDLEKVKFIDFGLCIDLCKCQQTISKQFCGTLSYLPPEIVQNKPYEPKKADIWSLGILLYGLAIRRLPYKGRNQMDLFQKICKNKLVFPEYFSSELKNLIQKMIKKEPNQRATISQIISHPWLN